MRTVGLVRQALDQMCERVLSRSTQGELLARKQLVQAMIADSWIELEQFRLLVLRTAWKIDNYNDYQRVRGDISAVKAAMPKVLHDVASRALQLHGSLGVSHEMPFASMVLESFHMGLADGATEVHKVTLAREVLKGYTRHRRTCSRPSTCRACGTRPRPASPPSSTPSVADVEVGLSVYDIASGRVRRSWPRRPRRPGSAPLWLGEHVVLPVDYRTEHPTTGTERQRVAPRRRSSIPTPSCSTR